VSAPTLIWGLPHNSLVDRRTQSLSCSTGILPESPTPGGCLQSQRPGESGWDLFWFRASMVRIGLHSI